MWPIPALEHKLVSIFFTQDALCCYWIEKVDNRTAPLVLRAYKRYSLDNLELTNLILFNPTVIKNYITSFLQEHDLEDAFIGFIFHGSAVTEQFVAMPTSTPHRTDFAMTHNTQSMLWEYRYLYPNDHGQFVFYVYSIPRSVVLQYQLLAMSIQCNLITMTTRTMSLLFAYQNIFGSAFRRSQLAVDMMRCNNNIADLITIDSVKRMVCDAADNSSAEGLYYAAAAGLFYSEGITV